MKIKCPACQAVLTVPDSAAGKVVKCPCGKQLRAPGGGSQPPTKSPLSPAAPGPAAAAGAGQPVRPGTPQTARPTPAAGGGFDAGLFDELTDQDLQPVASQYTRSQTQPPTVAAGGLPPGGKPKNYLIQSILVTLCCCLPLGIVAIVYAAQVDSKWNVGDHQGAISASGNAKKWFWIAFGLGIVINLLSVGFQIVAVIAAGNAGP